MVSPWRDIHTLLLHDVVCVIHRVINQQLIRCFSRLPLHAVHEAPAEDDDLVAVNAAGVAMPSNDLVLAAVLQLFPLRGVGARHQTCDLGVAFKVLATDQVTIVVNTDDLRVFARCRDPAFCFDNVDLGVEGFTLLIHLNVSLKTTGQLLH